LFSRPIASAPTFKFPATAVNGNQPSRTFTVTYNDGSTAT
jgi:hypothetical protein